MTSLEGPLGAGTSRVQPAASPQKQNCTSSGVLRQPLGEQVLRLAMWLVAAENQVAPTLRGSPDPAATRVERLSRSDKVPFIRQQMPTCV
jgi:hypothetical protein